MTSTVTTVEDWKDRAASLDIRGDAFVDGGYVPASSGATMPVISPVDGTELAEMADSTAEDVDAAVHAARKAFDSGVWSETGLRERKEVLMAFAAGVRNAVDELALLITLDMGKPILDSVGEAQGVARFISYYAEAVDKVFGEVNHPTATSMALVTREPMGVVAAVTPWNYPAMMPTWKFAPALAAGNSVIVKPAEQASLAAIRLAEIATDAGLPAGVLNVLPGRGSVTGAALGRHHDVDALAFTGSTEVGKMFLTYSGESNMKSISLECGGKSPQIVLADAPDLAVAAEAVAEGVFVNAGEMCNAGTRLLIDASIHDEFLDAVVAASRQWYPKHPFDHEAKMGTLVDQAQTDRVLDYIGRGQNEGATLVEGGRRIEEESGGLYVEPTIFTDVKQEMTIAQEEIFGPVLATIPFSSLDEALEIANGTIYGLAASIWTRDLSTAHRVARQLRAGNVYINSYDRSDNSLPFGGYKQSGQGVDRSLHAMEKYTRLKTTWIELS